VATSPSTLSPKGLFFNEVEATRRLLNFSWLGFEARKSGCGYFSPGNRMSSDRNDKYWSSDGEKVIHNPARRSVNKTEIGRRRRSAFDLGEIWRPGWGKAVTCGPREDFELTGFPCEEWPWRNDFSEAGKSHPILLPPGLGLRRQHKNNCYPMNSPNAFFIDRSDKHLDFTVLDGAGELVERGKVSTDPQRFIPGWKDGAIAAQPLRALWSPFNNRSQPRCLLQLVSFI
jgi:hypothetical protein